MMHSAGALIPDSGLASTPVAGAPARPGDAAAWKLLDEQDEWLEFSRRAESAAESAAGEGVWESSVVFEGMHCAACATAIEQALRAVPGVREAEVSAASHRGRVVWDEAATRPSNWMSAAQRAGYRPLPAHDAYAAELRQADTRKMLWRLGVAGVCMMQVMMYATPTYFTAPGEIESNVVNLLRWAQWLLSIPVILFSCRPFFGNALRDLRQRRVSMDLPVSLGMLITFVVSTLGTFEPQGLFGREVYFDSLTMFVFFLLTGRWLELRLRDRTAGALEALMHRLPDSVQRQRADGNWERVSARRLRVGDVMLVVPGEVFPADGQILKGRTATDEALLTGESTPLGRGEGDAVVAGSHNLTAPVEVRVQRVGGETRYAQIVQLMEQASVSKPHIAVLADRLAMPFLVAVLLAAALAGAWWWPTDPGHALMIAVAVLVVTCPCALSLATPAAMLASAGALARQGVLVRRLAALEALAQVDMVVFDKTGTLTSDQFQLASVRMRSGVSREQALALGAALARLSLHPVSRALAAAGGAQPPQMLHGAREVPGKGIEAQRETGGGAAARVRLGSAAFCGVAPEAGDGPVSYLVDGQGWLASFGFRETLRGDAAPAVAALHRQGLQVRLMSGDSGDAASRIGQRAGIDDAVGDCQPDDKLRLMRAEQARGLKLAMVGDGLNDGPVLAGADVSFAFGRSVPLARAQSDLVVLGERLMLIPASVTRARKTMRVVRQNLGWAAAYNAVGVPLAMGGWMPPWAAGLGMAASSLLVVLNALRLTAAEPLTSEGH